MIKNIVTLTGGVCQEKIFIKKIGWNFQGKAPVVSFVCMKTGSFEHVGFYVLMS